MVKYRNRSASLRPTAGGVPRETNRHAKWVQVSVVKQQLCTMMQVKQLWKQGKLIPSKQAVQPAAGGVPRETTQHFTQIEIMKRDSWKQGKWLIPDAMKTGEVLHCTSDAKLKISRKRSEKKRESNWNIDSEGRRWMKKSSPMVVELHRYAYVIMAAIGTCHSYHDYY